MIVQQVTRAGLEPATYGLKVDGGERKDNDLARARSEEASSEVPQCPTSSDPPATNSATANFAPCGERRGFCICKREETWFARYRGWTLYAGRIDESAWRVSLHRFNGPGADMPSCAECYPTLEGAQNAAEFYAENERWPHAKEA